MLATMLFMNSVAFDGLEELFSIPELPSLSDLLPDWASGRNAVKAADEYEDKWSGDHSPALTTAEDVVAYSWLYQNNATFAADHCADIITIAFTSSAADANKLGTDFQGIGTSDNPFEGTVKLGSSGSYSIQTHRAFFSYISDKAQLTDANGALVYMNLIRLSSVGDDSSAPLFADHVIHDNSVSTAANWKVEISGSNKTFSGAVGEVGDGALVNLDFKNTANPNVVANAAYSASDPSALTDAGLFAGSIGAGAQYTVIYDGSFDKKITSANGNAGTFVGTMESGSSLTVVTSCTSTSSTVEASGSDDGKGYAGGLVGKADSTTEIHLKTSVSAADSLLSSLTVGGTVTATSGAGGLYGYYKIVVASSGNASSGNTRALPTDKPEAEEETSPKDTKKKTEDTSETESSNKDDSSKDASEKENSEAEESSPTDSSESSEKSEDSTVESVKEDKTDSTEPEKDNKDSDSKPKKDSSDDKPSTKDSSESVPEDKESSEEKEEKTEEDVLEVAANLNEKKSGRSRVLKAAPKSRSATFTIDLKDYTVTATSYAKYCGGLFGVLEAERDVKITNTGSSAKTYTSGTGSDYETTGYYGGVAGRFESSALANTTTLESLEVSPTASTKFKAFGGVFGIVGGATYVKADDVSVTATGTAQRSGSPAFFGGLVGATSSTKGVFIDLGDFTLDTGSESFKGGGVVGHFYKGVLRFSGTTDMSDAKCASGDHCGQLIGDNDNVLVYALGTGSNGTAYESGWTFKRSNSSKADDLGTWGEVVRISDVETDILTYNDTAHTVTLKAPVTSMGTPTDFTKTALNIQLNQGEDYDCLLFANKTNKRSVLLGSSLTISANISLVGTGITGLMRDGGDVSELGTFTGTLDGTNGSDVFKITLATGEVYGRDSSGNAVTASTEGAGQIYRHQHTGLFSVLGGTVSNLEIAGTITVRNLVDGMNIGSVASRNNGSVTLTNVIAGKTASSLVINYHESSKVDGTEAAGKNIGGYIGFVGSNGTITINGVSSVGAKIYLTGSHESWNVYGGIIGKITANTFTVNIGTANDPTNKLTIALDADVSGITAVSNNSDGGGLIGHIINKDNAGTNYSQRIVNLNNVEFNGCKVGNAASTNAGGFFGYAWLNTTANINGVTISGDSAINNNGANSNVGIMCYEATGKWNVDSLTVSKMSMTSGGADSLGFLVNKAYHNANDITQGLYLNVLKAGYKLTDKSGNTGITLPSSLGIYDEIAAYSASSAEKVLTGGAGVISINMNSSRSGTNTKINSTGTYQNQLTSASSSALGNTKYANKYARYYYNVDVLKKNNDAENILLWSLNKYSASNIKGEFDTSISNDTLTGTADMTGLSFYPLPLADGVTLNALTLTLDYSDIYSTAESAFNSSYNPTDGYKRDPGAANQHYLMHSGLFLNSSAGTTLTINGELSLNGNFLEVGKYKGVLISDTMRGSITTGSSGSIVLNGIVAKTTGNIDYSSGYALVNNIKRADASVAIPKVTLSNISTGTYSTGTHFKSLLGAAEGPGLSMTFSGIKLDGRVSNTITSLDTVYNTTQSIFSESTLVNSIRTDNNAQLIYNYTYLEDWGGTPSSRNVTYGYEVKYSVEYSGRESKYSTSSGGIDYRWYTQPDSAPTGSSTEYDFSGFRKYVYNNNADYTGTPDSDGFFYRELRVNVEEEGLTNGCGTYNDPYIITTGEQLRAVAAFIKDNTYATTLGNVNLPKTVPSSFTSGDRWCASKSAHGEYTANGNSFTAPTGGASWVNDQVRSWLCNAYYKINANTITLDNQFDGLGGTTANTAWRGVIVGNGTNAGEPTVTIINQSSNPLINVSNGSVIKDINIVVKNSTGITRTQTNAAYNNAFFSYDYTSSNVCKFYGGVIGEIMGGDNIIDNSYVTYNYTDGSETKTTQITLSGSQGTIVPVGGYVGVVVFGGLIFKNIDASKTTLAQTGLKVIYSNGSTTTTGGVNLANSNQESWATIYVNPLVGRVINGYAVNETGGNAKDASGASVKQLSTSEDGKYHDDDKNTRSGAVAHTLKNGTKHYSIADLNPDLMKLDVTKVASSSEDGNIDVPNAQALFVLSLITQSCAGTAQSATGDYKTSLSYGTYSTKEYGESSNTPHVYGMNHIADYSHVGSATLASDSDYLLAKKDTAGNTANTNYAIPYIIYHYTKDTNGNKTGNFNARCVTSTSGYYDINLTGKTAYGTVTPSEIEGEPDTVTPLDEYTYQLPDSFRGLGSVGNYDYNTKNDAYKNPFSIKLDSFSGDGCIIDEDIYINKYKTDNYFDNLHKGANQVFSGDSSGFKGNGSGGQGLTDNHGIGLFDSVIMKNADSSIGDFTLSGSVNTEIFNNSYAKTSQEWIGVANLYNDTTRSLWLSVGGVCGWSTNGRYVNFTSIDLNNLTVNGADFIGGLLGFSGIGDTTIRVKIKQCSANDISVKMTSAHQVGDYRQSRNGIGAFVGKVQEGAVVIYGTEALDNNNDLSKFTEVRIKSFGFADETLQYFTSTGGLVGFAGHCCQAYDMKVTSSSNTVTIGNELVRYSGGIVGGMQSYNNNVNEKTCIAYFKNCIVENLNVAGEYAGGFYGGKWDSAWTPYSITFDNCKVIGKSENDKNSISSSYIPWNRKIGSTTYSNELPCAGGLIGRGLVKTSADENQSNILIRNCIVSNYEITAAGESTGVSQKGCAGGFVGCCSSNADKSTITCYIHDSAVENCIIGATGSYSYGGGAIGWVNPNQKDLTKVNKMLGYNIKLDNVTSNNNSNMGAWVGFLNSNDTTTSIQFAGIGVYGNGFAKNVGNGRTLGTASFVFADYTGTCNGSVTTGTAEAGEESSESYSIDSSTKTITRTIVTISSASKTTRTLIYNYTTVPTESATTETNGWSIDETNGKITKIENGTKYVYTIAVSGLNKGTTVAMPKYPFVNINPQSKLGSSEIISGDGAVLNSNTTGAYAGKTSAKTMAAYIYSEKDTTGTAKQYYSTFDDDVISSNNTIDYYMKRTTTDDGDRISTFATEQGINLPATVADFACIVIANTDDVETTNLINRYIQLVTNTPNSGNTANFAADNEYYKLNILACEYNPSTESFTLTGDAPGLDWDETNDKFSLDINNADSLKSNRFTLLDVQFLDPFGKDKIAYHLYVPVYTVREMPVNFYSSAMTGAHSVVYTASGTTNPYEALMSATCNHADTMDNWMTHYIRYEYQAKDINALLDSGNLAWGYQKSVKFDTFTIGNDDTRLPDGTYMVLVDPNGNYDNVYYAEAGDMTSYNITGSAGTKTCWQVDLANFTGADGTTAFTAPSFNRMLAKSIIATPSTGNTGKYDVIAESAITANDTIVYLTASDGTKTYYKYNTEGNGTYNLSVDEGTAANPATYCEDYYISIYVPHDDLNKLYHYSVGTAASLSSSNVDYYDYEDTLITSGDTPSERSAGVTKQNDCTILIADLFTQTVSSMTVTPNNEQITANNKEIKVDISTTVTPKNNNGIVYLDGMSDIYHSFYITLGRHDATGTHYDIQGLGDAGTVDDYVTATYKIDNGSSRDCANIEMSASGNYLNIQTTSKTDSSSLISKLRNQGSFVISSTIVMDFDEEELENEFPERDSGSNYGVNVEAASKLAYNTDALAYSSISESFTPDSKYYYRESVLSATLRYTSKADDWDNEEDKIGYDSGNRSTLGVNGRSAIESEVTEMRVNSQAYYNVQSLADAANARWLKLTFALNKKTDSNSGISYQSISSMQNYLTGSISFKLGADGTPVTATATGSSVTVWLDVTGYDLAANGNIYDIYISFNAKTGTGFANYANYKVDLAAELFKDNAHQQNVENSSASDYLIYTNAKINPNILKSIQDAGG